MHFTEKERQLQVIYDHYDVVVAGAGIAGIAAAVSAARCGRHVLLVDRGYMAGGLATAGLVTIYLPLCDGKGHQVSFGLAEELLRLSISHGWERDYPASWINKESKHGNERYQVRFNAQTFSILAENLMAESGVDILYGTLVCGVVRDGEQINALIVENKDGRSAIQSAAFIDATGDADLFSYADEETVLHEKGNIPAAWFYETIDGRNVLHMYGAADVLSADENTAVPDTIDSARISGINAWENSNAVLKCHSLLFSRFLEKGEVSEEHSLSAIATIPQFRMTRRISGAYTLDESEDHSFFEDSIGLCGDWRKRGPVFEIPYRTLYSPNISNMLAAGRCISVTDPMWDITRVIPVAAVTGEAAGAAAAFSGDLRQLDISELQGRLRAAGVVIHINELG